jgi:hypothetical protein
VIFLVEDSMLGVGMSFKETPKFEEAVIANGRSHCYS